MLSIATPAIVGCGKSIPSKPRSRASAGYKSVVNADRRGGAICFTIFSFKRPHGKSFITDNKIHTIHTKHLITSILVCVVCISVSGMEGVRKVRN